MSDQIESAAAVMIRHYIILAFLVSLGALQIAVSISCIRGLWLIPNRILTRTLGIMLIILGLAFYILSPLWLEGPWAAGSVVDGTSEDRVWGTAALSELSAARNLNDIHGGMAGTAYAGFFVLSAVLATLFATVIGTINIRLLRPTISPSFGITSQNSTVSPTGRTLEKSTVPPAGRTLEKSTVPPAGRTLEKSTVPPAERVSENSMVSPAQRGKCPKDKGGHHSMLSLDGLDALKNANALNTFKSSLRNLRRTGRDDIRNHLRSAHRWSIPSMIGRMRRN